MKSRNEIKIDFQRAKNQVDELEQIAREMKQLATNDLTSDFQNLSNAWKGDAATAYMQKGNILREKIISNAGALMESAELMRSAATRTYNAEMRAYQLAMERKYNS